MSCGLDYTYYVFVVCLPFVVHHISECCVVMQMHLSFVLMYTPQCINVKHTNSSSTAEHILFRVTSCLQNIELKVC